MSKSDTVTQLPTASPARGLAIQSWDDLVSRAKYLANSQLVPAQVRGKEADVAIILQMGLEVGLSPMQALQSIDVIQGKPGVKPEAQLGMIYNACPDAVIEIEVDTKALVAKVSMARSKDRKPFVSVWDMARAKMLGLDQKDNYKKQPATMLKWRAVGEAARTIFPDITRGMKNVFEYDEEAQGTEPPVNKAAKLSEILSPAEPKEVKAEVVEPHNAHPGDAIIGLGKFKGSRFKNVGPAQIQADLNWWEDLEAQGAEVNGQGREFINNARAFLASVETTKGE